MFLTEAANRGSISTGYDIDNSIKLEQPERLQRGYDGAGNIGSITATDRKRTTLSYWVKRTQLNASGNGIVFIMYAGNTIMLGFENDKLRVSTSYGYSLISNALFRDTSAWYHLVFSIDTTQGTANDRVKAYVNGAEVTSWGTQSISISQNANNGMFNEVNGSHYFGWLDAQATGCYLAEAHCIDGQALAASDFGEYDEDSGIWIPKEYEGTYGNQGYYLDFKTSSNLGTDSSGNGNNFGSLYGIGAENQATDTPTNNFCTLNPLHNYYNEVSRFTVSEGGTKATGNQSSTLWRGIPSSLVASSGKWYFEVEQGNQNSSMMVGVGSAEGQTEWAELTSIASNSTKAKMMYSYNGGIYGYNSSTDAWQYGGGWNANGYIQSFAIDLDNGYMYSRRNGSAWIGSGNPSSGATGTGGIYIPWHQTNQTVFIVTIANNAGNAQINFGGYTVATPSSAASDANGYGNFEYAPPSGYYALCTKNLAEYGG